MPQWQQAREGWTNKRAQHGVVASVLDGQRSLDEDVCVEIVATSVVKNRKVLQEKASCEEL